MPRSMTIQTALASLLAGVLATAAPAQIDNPGFEAGGGSLSGWTTFNNAVPNVVPATLTPRTGGTVAKVFGSFSGSPNFSGVLQNQPAAAGETWDAAVWVRHNSGDALTGTSNALVLKIEFYAVPGGAYGSADMLAEFAATVLDGGSPTDAWLAGSLQGVAPPGTVEARIALVFAQPSGQGGAALIDDVTFTGDGAGDGGGWVLYWNDEFDGPGIDANKWRVEDVHIIKNNELQYYAPDEAYLDNGDLVLRSRARSYWGFDTNGNWNQYDYTSGLVDTRGRFAFTYGKVEIRAQLPGTQGMWPAHWMLADAGGWPPEVDIMEMVGFNPFQVHMSNHWGPLGPNGEPPWETGRSESGTYGGPDFTQDYHTFGIEWFPDRIQYHVDGVQRFAATGTIPDVPMYLILNTAVGGFWPGPPDATTVFPQHHRIDYVRVYAWSGAGAGLQTIDDTTATTATVDGTISGGEYIGQVSGLNDGLFDVIGTNSRMLLDSSADGRLTVAVDSTTAYLNPYGVTLYIDSVPGGFPSNVSFQDDSDRPARLASGRGTAGERAPLYFAPGFLADYAIVLQPGRARLLELGEATHTLRGGADAGAATDIDGGTDFRYEVAGDVARELQLPLAALGLAPGESFRVFATLANATTAFRANEFIGVAPGNDFDAANPGNATVVLKTDDFVTFLTAEAVTCGGGCAVAGGDADLDGDCDVDLSDLAAVLANFGQADAGHAAGDTDADGDVDLTDLANVLSLFGAVCP